MRNLKKFLALVLAFMMAMSLMVTANAVTANVEFPDSDTVITEFQEDVTVMAGMGVIQGHADTGTFAPKANVTRAQMAAIVYRLATGDASDARSNLYKDYHSFSDVKSDAWYAGYVGYCADAGYIQGYPDGSFKPNDPVTGYAALAMILRAMGYNETGHNFVGGSWKAETGATATQRQMLVNINKSIYANTLNYSAPRELVAEMAFQGATKEMVQWTNAYGYQTTGMLTGTPGSGAKNPSLGLLYYGLTCNNGVIVGNQATGETVTKIGFDLSSARTASELNITGTAGSAVDGSGATVDVITAITGTTQQTAFVTAISNKVGAGSNAYITASDTTNALPKNVTRTFKWESGLKQFGHAVTVWYDNRSNSTVTVGNVGGTTGTAEFTTNLNTYAVFDRVVATKVVPGVSGAGALVLTNTGDNTMTKVARGEDFVVDTTNGTYWNYSFGPTGARNVDGTAANVNITSPIIENNSGTAYPLYLLISNSASNSLDMVVSLDMTITQITQQNNVLAPLTVGVYNSNKDNSGITSTPYFDTADTVQVATGNVDTYANIAQKNLVTTSIGKELGDLGKKVAAIEITGTTGTNPGSNYTDGNGGNATPATGMNSTYYYQLTELTKVVPGTVVKIDTTTQKVWLSDGNTLDRSVFALATDGSFKANQYVNAPVVYSTYNFYLDENGEYIFWEPIANTTKFVYGTYMDYTTPLNSSVYTYSMTGVGIDGKQTVDSPVTSFTVANTYAGVGGNSINAAGASNANFVQCNWTTVPPTINRYPFASGANYNSNLMPKRDATGLSANVTAGQYIGYTINADGQLTAVTDIAGGYGGTAEQPVIQAASTDFGNAPISIGARDVAVGAKEVVAANATTGIPGLYLTNNTVFYVVSGAGVDTQEIAIYNGIDELMEGMDTVVIDLSTSSPLTTASRYLKAMDGTTDTTEDAPWKMAYYTRSPFTYAQDYVNSAYQVDIVFIPEEAITPTPSLTSNLVFVGNNASTLVNAIGRDAVQFTMYKDGVQGSYWIAGKTTDAAGASSAGTVLNLGKNVFYRLIETNNKAMDGEPIYVITAVATASGGLTVQQVASNSIIGQFYDGTTTLKVSSNIATAPASYKATTYDSQVAFIDDAAAFPASADLYRVGDTVVKNLNTRNYPGIVDTLATLNQASSLTTNAGVNVSCILNATNSTAVSVVYVNAP